MADHRIEVPLIKSIGSAYPFYMNGTHTDLLTYALEADEEGYWYGRVYVPSNYNSGGKLYVTLMANATTGVTRLQVSVASVADGENFDVAYTSETEIDVTVPGTAYYLKEQVFPSTGNLAATIAAHDWLLVQLFHDGDHANDTLAVDTLVVGVTFEFTV